MPTKGGVSTNKLRVSMALELTTPSSFGDENGILDQLIGDELKPGKVEDRYLKAY